MRIHFPNDPPQYCGPDLTLTFPAVVDGKRVDCRITAEALEDHFGARAPREEDALHAFNRHRDKIHGAARELLETLGDTPVILHSGYFRFRE